MERDPEDLNRDQTPGSGGGEEEPVDGPAGDERGQGATSQDEPTT